MVSDHGGKSRVGSSVELFEGTWGAFYGPVVAAGIQVVYVRRLHAVSRELLARLWQAAAAPGELGAALMRSTQIPRSWLSTAGPSRARRSASPTSVRGYHPQLATCA